MVSKLNFGSCEEIKSHGVKIPATFNLNGAMTYCPAWSELIVPLQQRFLTRILPVLYNLNFILKSCFCVINWPFNQDLRFYFDASYGHFTLARKFLNSGCYMFITGVRDPLYGVTNCQVLTIIFDFGGYPIPYHNFFSF